MKEDEITTIAKRIADRVSINTKEVLTLEEAALYMGLSKSGLYGLTHTREIPHYKPKGKRVYFNRVEVEEWMQANRIPTSTEIADVANRYCMKGGVK